MTLVLNRVLSDTVVLDDREPGDTVVLNWVPGDLRWFWVGFLGTGACVWRNSHGSSACSSEKCVLW